MADQEVGSVVSLYESRCMQDSRDFAPKVEIVAGRPRFGTAGQAKSPCH